MSFGKREEQTKVCSCGATLIFIEVERARGKTRMPCEAKETIIYTKTGRQFRGHQPHWGNCPDAGKYRGGGS